MYTVYESSPDGVLEPPQQIRIVREPREADHGPRDERRAARTDATRRRPALEYRPRRGQPDDERPEEELRRQREPDARRRGDAAVPEAPGERRGEREPERHVARLDRRDRPAARAERGRSSASRARRARRARESDNERERGHDEHAGGLERQGRQRDRQRAPGAAGTDMGRPTRSADRRLSAVRRLTVEDRLGGAVELRGSRSRPRRPRSRSRRRVSDDERRKHAEEHDRREPARRGPRSAGRDAPVEWRCIPTDHAAISDSRRFASGRSTRSERAAITTTLGQERLQSVTVLRARAHPQHYRQQPDRGEARAAIASGTASSTR